MRLEVFLDVLGDVNRRVGWRPVGNVEEPYAAERAEPHGVEHYFWSGGDHCDRVLMKRVWDARRTFVLWFDAFGRSRIEFVLDFELNI